MGEMMKLFSKIIFVCFLFLSSIQVRALEYLNDESFSLTFQGVNKRNVYVNENATVYINIIPNSELTYSKVELFYQNINSNTDKLISVENTDLSNYWSYIPINFSSEDALGEWTLENVKIYTTNEDVYIYDRASNVNFSFADFNLRNTPFITDITFSPSFVSPGDQVTLSVDISDLNNDVYCVSFLPYQELDFDLSCADNGLLLSKEGDSNRFSGSFYIPENEYNWVYGIYKLVAYTFDNKVIDILEPLEPNYTIINGLETGISLNVKNKYVNTGDTLIFDIGMIGRPNSQMLGTLSYFYPDSTIESLEISNWIRLNADSSGVYNGALSLLINDTYPSGLYKLNSFNANNYFTPDPNEKVINQDSVQQYAFCVNCIQLQSIKFDKNEYTLKAIDEAIQLDLDYLPIDATDKSIIWESSNPTVATVNNGLIKAISEGTTTITAKNLFSNLITTTTIYVRIPKVEVNLPQTSTESLNANKEVSEENLNSKKQMEAKKIYAKSINLLKEILSDENIPTIDINELVKLLKDAYKYNSDFISDLDENIIQNLLNSLDKNYLDFININFTGRVSNVKLDMPIMINDLRNFLAGKKVTYELLVNNKVSSSDQKLLDTFAKENDYISTSLVYYDISLFNSTESEMDEISNLDRPITITLPIPSGLDLTLDFKFAHLHNGKVELVPIVINEDGTFSFTISKLSAFVLLTDKIIVETSAKDINILSSNRILILCGILILSSALYYIIKRVKINSN